MSTGALLWGYGFRVFHSPGGIKLTARYFGIRPRINAVMESRAD
jgi:hypothetical protein